MPPAHQAVAGWSADRFLRWAEEIGPQTSPAHRRRSGRPPSPPASLPHLSGFLSLAKRYGTDRLEAACRRALTAGISSYKGLHNILKNNLDQLDLEPVADTPLPAHANIRGQGYYN